MREFTAGFSAISPTQSFLPRGIQVGLENLKGQLKKKERLCCHAKAWDWQPMNQKPSTFSLRFCTDVPLYESPGVLLIFLSLSHELRIRFSHWTISNLVQSN